MDYIKVEIRSLVAKFETEENHALGKMQNLASERQIKQFKQLLASKEHKLQKLIIAIITMKEGNKIKQEQYVKSGDNRVHGERVYIGQAETIIR